MYTLHQQVVRFYIIVRIICLKNYIKLFREHKISIGV